METRRTSVNCETLIFDWDGTLVNSLDMKIENAGQLFNTFFGYSSELVEQAYRQHSGVPRRVLFDAISNSVGSRDLTDSEYFKISCEFTELNLFNLNENHLFNDTVSTLDYLNTVGLNLFVSSSATPEDVVASAKRLGIYDKFVKVLGSVKGFGKGPEHISYILNKYNLNSENVVMVGDERADVMLAKMANVYSVAKRGSLKETELTELNPDLIISSLSELSKLVKTES